MPRNLKTLAVVFLPLLTLLLGWQLGMRAQARALSDIENRLAIQFNGGTASGAVITDPEKQVDASLLWSTWKLLTKFYVQPKDLNAQKMLFGAVKGMVQAVGDPYTVFMTPVENDDFRRALSGKLEGIGAELALRDGMIVVVSPLKGSPAMRAGLTAGDIILSVDGVPTDGKTLQEVVTQIRGPKGTTVQLEVRQSEQAASHVVSIVRESITIPSVESRIEQGEGKTIGYLAINEFGDDTTDETRAALEEMKKQNITNLVMDLRYNGGGYLDGAVDIVSMFQKQGKVVTVARREGEPQVHYVSGNTIFPDVPMVVLINEGSASASEITAGALQDNKRATIMGTQSFGKGTVQEVMDLPGGSSLRVTIAHWLTPSGRDLGKQGVTPNILVVQPDGLKAGDDPQLQAVFTFIRTGVRPVLPATSAASSASSIR